MSFLREKIGMMKDIFKFSEQPQFENPSLIVGWNEDAGRLSPKVIDYLNRQTKGKSFCEIEPAGFFPLGAVAIENNVAQFPESKFYYSQKDNLVIFKGNEPQFARHRFLNASTQINLSNFYLNLFIKYQLKFRYLKLHLLSNCCG